MLTLKHQAGAKEHANFLFHHISKVIRDLVALKDNGEPSVVFAKSVGDGLIFLTYEKYCYLREYK